MLVKPRELKRYWNITPIGVLHVGAHLGEEKELYEEANWGPIIWVEAQPDLAQNLKQKVSHSADQVYCATIWDKNDVRLKLNISSNSGSSSLLEFGTHKDSYPEISFTREIDVVTTRLDSLLTSAKLPNFLNLDIQGVELQALRSLGDLINSLDYIYVEINTKEVYRGCTRLDDLDDFLSKAGFKREITRRYLRHGWGEALFIRKGIHKTKPKTFFMRISNIWSFYRVQLINFVKHLMRGTLGG